ncbi:MAG: DUF1080 domain-containing protein [Anaerolineae bacterium]|nr:DUF1080 domain-containing protein [Anaerolineae bacterium]
MRTNSKKRLLLTGLALGVSMIACLTGGNPTAAPPGSPLTQDPNAAGTSVAHAVETQQAFNTSVVGEVNTQQATMSPIPSLTHETSVTDVVQTLIAAVTQTHFASVNTQAPTSNPTHMPGGPTPTFPSGDPRLSLGNPSWVDTFDSTTNWNPFNSTYSKGEIKDGKFYMTAKSTTGGSRWVLSWPQIHNFYIEAEMISGGMCVGLDRYGLIIRAPDTGSGLMLAFSCDGRYEFLRWQDNSSTVLIDWTSNPAINKGPNQYNRMGIRVNGNAYSFYANGVLLTATTHNSYNASNRFGLVIGASSTPNFYAMFETLLYWTLP